MAIDINNRLGLTTPNSGKRAENARGEGVNRGNQSHPGREAQAEDSVTISDDAASLRAMQTRLEHQDSFDEARVNAFKQAIARGEYPIDNQRLAEKFLQLESKL